MLEVPTLVVTNPVGGLVAYVLDDGGGAMGGCGGGGGGGEDGGSGSAGLGGGRRSPEPLDDQVDFPLLLLRQLLARQELGDGRVRRRGVHADRHQVVDRRDRPRVVVGVLAAHRAAPVARVRGAPQ